MPTLKLPLVATSALLLFSARTIANQTTSTGSHYRYGFLPQWRCPADTATFSGISSSVNTNTTISLNGAAVGNIIFDTANAAAHTQGSGAVGSQTFTLGNGTAASAITVNSSVVNDQLFNSNITLGDSKVAATYTFQNDSPTAVLTIAGNATGQMAGGAGCDDFTNAKEPYNLSGLVKI
jgi:hypothetical protein